MAAAGKGFTVVIHRDGALESRQIRIARWAYRTLVTLGTILGIFVIAVIVLYGPIVTAAGKAPLLQLEVNRLTRENRRVQELAQRLDEAEARYAHLRGMLGANVVPPARGAADTAPRATSDERLYVGPPFFARAPDAAGGADSSGPTVPSRWPLTVRSYRTRGPAARAGRGPPARPACRSVSRTDQPRATTARAIRAIARSSASDSSARAWPADSAPESRSCWTGLGSLRRRMAFATVERSRPTDSAMSACDSLNSAASRS